MNTDSITKGYEYRTYFFKRYAAVLFGHISELVQVDGMLSVILLCQILERLNDMVVPRESLTKTAH